MEFFDTLNARHSIRAYVNRPVDDKKLERIFEAINQAPSAGNLQAFEVYVVTTSDDLAELANAALGQDFIAQAPVALIFCAHAARSAERYGTRGADLYCLQDATIACTFAMLTATTLGLSSVWVGAFHESAVRQIIRAPQTHRPVAILPIGYPAERAQIRPRRKINDLFHRL